MIFFLKFFIVLPLILLGVVEFQLVFEYLKQSNIKIGHKHAFRLAKKNSFHLHPPHEEAYLETGDFFINEFGLIGEDYREGVPLLLILGSSTSMRYGAWVRKEVENNHLEAQVWWGARTGNSIRGVIKEVEHLFEMKVPIFHLLFVSGGGATFDLEKNGRLYDCSEGLIALKAFSDWKGDWANWHRYFMDFRWSKLQNSLFEQFPFKTHLDLKSKDSIRRSRPMLLREYAKDISKLNQLLKNRGDQLLWMSASVPRSPEYKEPQMITDTLNDVLRKSLEEERASFLDLDKYFGEESLSEFKDRYHWNDLGDQKVARLIIANLMKSKALKKEIE